MEFELVRVKKLKNLEHLLKFYYALQVLHIFRTQGIFAFFAV